MNNIYLEYILLDIKLQSINQSINQSIFADASKIFTGNELSPTTKHYDHNKAETVRIVFQ